MFLRRRPPGLLASVALAAALLAAGSPVAADAPAASASVPRSADAARRAAVVAHVGPRAITVGELEDRLAAVPRFQLLTFGSTSTEIARKFLDQIVVPDVILALGAADQHLDQEIQIQHAIDRALSNATLRALRNSLGPASAIPMDEVKRFYDANKNRFDVPERMNLWHIECATRDEAQKVLDEAKKDGTLATFTKLAREHSVDKATFLRGGNLGFVSPDGTSNEPGILVSAAVVKAAQGVKEGELVPQPIPEAGGFDVVWRRGSVPATHRSLEDMTAQIRDTLWRQKKEAAEKELLDRLHREKVSEVNESLLGTFDVSTSDGTISPRRRPGQLSAPP